MTEQPKLEPGERFVQIMSALLVSGEDSYTELHALTNLGRLFWRDIYPVIGPWHLGEVPETRGELTHG